MGDILGLCVLYDELFVMTDDTIICIGDDAVGNGGVFIVADDAGITNYACVL